MKTEKEIKERLKWLMNALDEPDNQIDTIQNRLWAQIDFIKWLGVKNG